ncbi:hypothetical protein AB0D99_16075 [Streptomyces sp. NPDC047971]|uniref:hypothetical protein n=1 Tax=Streptomyces sp. NPDC047971 TaxID=3154499 RepID=UPI00340BE142
MAALAVRPLLSAALVTLALGGSALAGAPAAVAAPGDNGDVKVHHAGRPGEEPRTAANNPVNNPSVCTFYFAAFNFDGLQTINWAITPQPPVDSVTTSGSITIDAAGHGISPDLTLADGRYKVEWTWEGQQGAEKSKVFRVDCDDSTSPPTNGTGGNGNGGNGNGGNGGNGANGGNGTGGNGNGATTGGTGAGPTGSGSWGGGATKPPQGPVGAGGGGSADATGTDSSAFGVGSAIAAALAGTVGLILVRRSRRRTDGAA